MQHQNDEPKHEGNGDCVWCTLVKTMQKHYPPSNPIPPDEAIPDITALLVHVIAALDDRSQRRAATNDVIKWVREGVPKARANGRYVGAPEPPMVQ